MNIKQIIITSLIALTSLSIFYSCDKIEEGEYFKPVTTDRFVLSEYIADAVDMDETEYNNFVSFSSTNNFATPILVLAGDTSVQGNTLVSNQLLTQFGLNTNSNSVMINRVQLSSTYAINKDDRTALLNSELEKEGNFSIEIESEFIDETDQFTSSFSVKSLNGYNEPIQLSVFIIEDSVIVNGFRADNVLNNIDYNIKTASALSRNEDSFKGSFQRDLSMFDNASKVNIVFVLSNSNTHEVLQLSKIKVESDNEGNSNLSFNKDRNVFIEDFTGHQCTFCPQAHRALKSLQDNLGDRVVGMAIHYGYQAATDDFEGFVAKYTTTVGTAIGDYFANQSDPLPFGFVNRISNNDNYKVNWGDWNVMVSDIIAQESQIGIHIDAKIENGKVTANLSTKAFEDISNPLKIQGFITESHLISKQKDSDAEGGIVEDYEQNHVLRGSIHDGNWGAELTTAAYLQDEIISKTFDYTLDSDWNTENLSLIVIVYDEITKEVLQVEEKHL